MLEPPCKLEYQRVHLMSQFFTSVTLGCIVQKGFDERHAYIGGMFGAGKPLKQLAL